MSVFTVSMYPLSLLSHTHTHTHTHTYIHTCTHINTPFFRSPLSFLLLQSSNGFSELFRPYSDPSLSPLSYADGMNTSISWARYNASYSDNDATEKDLFFCINSNPDHDKFMSMCGMDDGDVAQPIIKLRGNRAYLCRWMLHPEIKPHKDMLSLGITRDADLYEVGGCLLRLAMWPTDKLFDQVFQMKKRLFKGGLRHDDKDNESNEGVDYQIGVHFRCGDIAFGNVNSERICRFYPGDTEDGAMAKGTPPEFGHCVRQIADERVKLKRLYLENNQLNHELIVVTSKLNLPPPIIKNHSIEASRFDYLHLNALISADSEASALQINESLSMASLSSLSTAMNGNQISVGIFPRGCHIQFDKSFNLGSARRPP